MRRVAIIIALVLPYVRAQDANTKESYYSIGVSAWTKSNLALTAVRDRLDMRSSDPGILPNPERRQMQALYWSMIQEGIWNLDRALDLDPGFSHAMAYKGLLIRERAELRDTEEEYESDIAAANELAFKSFTSKPPRSQPVVEFQGTPPPVATTSRVRVDAGEQERKLVKKIEPIYPPLARAARITGNVIFTVVVGKDGSILNFQLVSGHPLLVPSATETLRKFAYLPTIIGGSAVEVVTRVRFKFELGFIEPQPVIF
jgi:TonB family protein